MKILQYCLTEGTNLAAIGRDIGVSRSYMHHLAHGRRSPTQKIVDDIEKATGGKVKLRDWLAIAARADNTVGRRAAA